MSASILGPDFMMFNHSMRSLETLPAYSRDRRNSVSQSSLCESTHAHCLSPPGCNRRFLDQKNIQVLALVVVDECFHPRSRFHDVQVRVNTSGNDALQESGPDSWIVEVNTQLVTDNALQ
jgi:hypothetical protein